MKKTILLIVLSLVISIPLFCVEATAIGNPLNASSFREIVVNIINWVIGIVALVAVLMVVVGGFQYMISGGDEEKTKQARKTIQYALIGLLIVGLSWSFVIAVLTIIGN